MIELKEKPLLSFCLVAFNQEQFIREAIEGAFAQMYSPLEIILSDDCSKDRTFEIIQRMATAYKGPHRVIANRTANNSGLVGHINEVVARAQGELIVGGAGDDVSLPERTEVIFDAWMRSGKKAHSIDSAFTTVDAEGRLVGEGKEGDGCFFEEIDPLDFVAQRSRSVSGCAHAFARRTFELFGPLPANIVMEDLPIGFRSVLLGPIGRIRRPLVKYRRHESNISAGVVGTVDQQSLEHAERMRKRMFQRQEDCYVSLLNDTVTAEAKELISKEQSARLQGRIARMRQIFRLRRELVGAHGWAAAKLVLQLCAAGASRSILAAETPRLLSKSLYGRFRLERPGAKTGASAGEARIRTTG